MIHVTAATDQILAHSLTLPETEVPLAEAVGRVLREVIYADRDFPPFNRVSMDGIAIRYETYRAGEDFFRIEGIQLAGAPPLTLQQADHCLEVMTGAMLPGQTDTVIRYEDIKIVERRGIRYAHILEAPKAPGQNVHRQGADRRADDQLIAAGTRLTPAEIAVAATVGKMHLRVSAPPRVALISTGDELVDLHEQPLPHQIRRSNTYMLQAALRQLGVDGQLFHLRDDKASMGRELQHLLTRFDALVLSGGVSKGKADFLPEVLAELGVTKLFHEVAQRPGKPFWFGRLENGPVVFALPGNPVSTFVCYYRYVQPWLQASWGGKLELPVKAVLQEEVTFKPNLTYFLPVKVRVNANGQYLARPSAHGGSGDLAALLEADGFLELPQESSQFPAGEAYPLILFRG